MDPQEIEDMVLYQVGALAAIARSEGVRLQHVKAHGALYNMAAKDRALAEAIARAVAAFDRALMLFGLPKSELIRAGDACGLRVVVGRICRSRVRARRVADAEVAPRAGHTRQRRRRAASGAHGGRGEGRRIDGAEMDARRNHLHARRHAGRAGIDPRAPRPDSNARGRCDCGGRGMAAVTVARRLVA